MQKNSSLTSSIFECANITLSGLRSFAARSGALCNFDKSIAYKSNIDRLHELFGIPELSNIKNLGDEGINKSTFVFIPKYNVAVNGYGVVASISSGKILSYHFNKEKGYKVCVCNPGIGKRDLPVAKLVAMAFCEWYTPGCSVFHKDKVAINNNYENLTKDGPKKRSFSTNLTLKICSDLMTLYNNIYCNYYVLKLSDFDFVGDCKIYIHENFRRLKNDNNIERRKAIREAINAMRKTEIENEKERKEQLKREEKERKREEFIDCIVREHGTLRMSGIENLMCTIDGKVFLNSKTYKLVKVHGYGKSIKHNLIIHFNRCTYKAKDIVAETFIKKLGPYDRVILKDLNDDNIAASNIRVVSKFDEVIRQRQSDIATVEESICRYDERIKEIKLMMNFLISKDYTEINKYIEERVFDILMDMCVKKGISKTKRQEYVSDAICRLYVYLDGDRYIDSISSFCVNILKKIISKRGYENVYAYNYEIVRSERVVTSVNFQKLCDKYNFSKKRETKLRDLYR